MAMEKIIQFKSETFLLSGNLHLPDKKKPPTIIGSHGLLSSSQSPKQIALAEACVKHNMAFFRFDHRGCGRSSGEFSSATTFEGRCRDLMEAVWLILDHPDTGTDIALFGSSFGGAISLAVSPNVQPKALVVVAAPVRLTTIHPQALVNPMDQRRIASLDPRALDFDISHHLFDISNILIFHGDADPLVPFSNALEIYEKTKYPKKLIRQTRGDHPMSLPHHQKAFIRLTIQWFQNALIPFKSLTDSK